MHKFLNINEKLKQVRKENNITQEELAFGIYTQGYITSIERGIKKPTEENIKLLVEKINEILVKRKVAKEISLEYFLRNKEEDENNYMNTLGEELESIKDKESLKDLFIKENLTILKLTSEKQISLYKKLLEKSKKVENFLLQKELCVFLIGKVTDNEEKVELFLELTRACAVLKEPQYIEVLEKEYKTLLLEKIDSKRKLIYQNLALIYRADEYYLRSLFYIEKMLELLLSNEQRLNILMSKGYTLYKMKRYDEAIKVYKDIIKKRERSKEFFYWAKLNLCEVYMELGKKDEVKKNYSLLKKGLKEGKKHLYGLRLLSMGKLALFLGKEKDGKEFLIEFLDYEIESPKIYREEDYVEGLSLLLLSLKRKERGIILKYLIFVDFIKTTNLKNKFILDIISFYNKNRLYSELNEFISIIKEKIK